VSAAVSGPDDSTRSTKSADGKQRGPILDVLRDLLAQGRNDEVLKLVAQLLLRNTELEKRLGKRRQGDGQDNASEGISSDQLGLLMHMLQEESEQKLRESDDKLKSAAQAPQKPEPQPKPKPQPSVRRPIPNTLRRVDNPIEVPDSERTCPTCGKARVCIDHDVTEVIELIPAEVIVRVDRREILVCKPCEGEMDRAPLGDKVVSGGIYGSKLVSTMLVRKYDHGMTLHRQREELLRLGLDMPSASASDQICWATDLLCPIWHEMQEQVLHAKLLQLDPTSLPVRDKEHGYGIQLGSLCAYIGDQQTVVYLYSSTGAQERATRRRSRAGRFSSDASRTHDGGRLRRIRQELHA